MNKKTQILKQRKVGLWRRRKCKHPNKWMTAAFLNCCKTVNKQSLTYPLKMLQILFTCQFCFYFTFTLYTNVLNTVVFMVRKGKRKEKSNLKANPPPPPSPLLLQHPFADCGMMHRRQPVPTLSLTQIKKKEAQAGDEKSVQR